MGNLVESNSLKLVLIELFKRDKELFLEVSRSVIQDDPKVKKALLDDRQARLEKIIDEDFAEYDSVFRALA